MLRLMFSIFKRGFKFDNVKSTYHLILDKVGTFQTSVLLKLIITEFPICLSTLIINTWEFCRKHCKIAWIRTSDL